MTDQQQKWLYSILVILFPLCIVYIFPHSLMPRWFAIILTSSAFPALGLLFALDPRSNILADTSRLNNTLDPLTLKKWNRAGRVVALIAGIAWFIYFTYPILQSTYDVNFKGIPLTIVNGSVLKLSSAVLAPGLYLGIHLKESPDVNYTHLFPTIYNFGDARYKLTLLTGTNFVLDVQPE